MSTPLSNADRVPDRWTNPWVKLVTMGGGLVALLAIAIVLLLEIGKPHHPPGLVRVNPVADPPATIVKIPPHLKEIHPTRTPGPANPATPNITEQPDVIPQSTSPPPQTSPQVTQQPPAEFVQAPPPRLIVAVAPAAPTVLPVRPYDRFGNPIGPDVGLGKDNEFKGKRLLFWSGFENAGRVFFGPTNPIWKAWERQGFIVRFQFGPFRTEWLKDIDQLWILSTGKFELPFGVPAETVVAAVDLLPAAAIPSGFTAAEYKFIVAATLDMSLSRCHPLNEQAYREIEKFVRSGKGLCLLSDDDPFLVESNELARRLYGVSVKGNYLADKTAYVRERNLPKADIIKFNGQYDVADHALLTGINFLYEGITISNVGLSDKLEVALKASDGQPLIAVSKVPGQRVVIDCAFTQFCHGPTEGTSYILKSAGAVRLAQNIAAYLAK